MLRLKYFFFVLFSLTVLSFNLSGQNQSVQVMNVKFFFNSTDNDLIITYDLINASPLEIYEIELSFIDAMNVLIRPVSVTGDVGKNVQGGKNKRIVWNIFDDVENLSETSHPVIQIISIDNKPVDPDLAIIMDQISKEDSKRYHFKIQRDGLLIGGLGCGVGAVVCRLKADEYIDEQNNAVNLDDYNRAGDNAQKYYTLSYIFGGVSAISTGFSVYQYIRDGKSKNKRTTLLVGPGGYYGICFSLKHRF